MGRGRDADDVSWLDSMWEDPLSTGDNYEEHRGATLMIIVCIDSTNQRYTHSIKKWLKKFLQSRPAE